MSGSVLSDKTTPNCILYIVTNEIARYYQRILSYQYINIVVNRSWKCFYSKAPKRNGLKGRVKNFNRFSSSDDPSPTAPPCLRQGSLDLRALFFAGGQSPLVVQ